MSRRDKRAARFGDRYRPPLDYRRLRKAVRDAKPAIHRITEAIRVYHERASFTPPDPHNVTAIAYGTDATGDLGTSHYLGNGQWRYEYPSPPDILDRIDSTLAYMTDAQTGRSDQLWPYGKQF